MKRTIQVLLSSIMIIMFDRCGEHVESLSLSHEEVAEMTATAIAESTSGLTMIIDTSLHVTTAILHDGDYCDYLENKSFTSTNADGAEHYFKYDYDYAYEVSCTGTAPQSLSTNVTFKGEFDSKRLTSQHRGMVDLVTTGLDNASANYTVNGDYESDGTYESRISDQSEGNNSLDIALANAVVRKSDGHFLSGTANVVISGFLADKRPYNAGATVTFNGDKTFTVNVRGVLFSVDIYTGAVKQITK